MMIIMEKSVAVIGSGPAGLMCAEQLNANGFKVTVFDELKEFGGMIAYGIPEFRIPLKNIRERILALKNKKIGFQNKKITSIKKLLRAFGGEFDFAVIAIGAGTGMKAGFKGEQEKQVIDALEFLLNDKLNNNKMISKGEEVAVIGGGNSAMDAARVAIKQGAKATIIYRRTENEMPALKNEIEGAKTDGVGFEFLKAPIEFRANSEKIIQEKKPKGVLFCAEMILGEQDESGRRKPIDSGKKTEYFFDKAELSISVLLNLNDT